MPKSTWAVPGILGGAGHTLPLSGVRRPGKGPEMGCKHLKVTVSVPGGEDKREGQATPRRQTSLLI